MFDETLRVILTLTEIEPAAALPPGLAPLFNRLRAQDAAHEAWSIEDSIWQMWTDHTDPKATAAMENAIAAVAGKRWNEAQALLDDLVQAQPLWAEAWNKRATLAFLRGADTASARDIRRTLCLEPRHFGALAGFAQICLRHGEAAAALFAVEAALRIHPHSPQIRILESELRRRHPPTLH
jgi:predicted Zn-dependent protease